MKLKYRYLVLMMLLVAGAADAATMKATYAGKVFYGYDKSGVFGDAETDLAGEAFTISFIYDTSKGGRTTAAKSDYLYGGNVYGTDYLNSPVTSASVDINGITYSFPGSYQAYVYETENLDDGSNDSDFALCCRLVLG